MPYISLSIEPGIPIDLIPNFSSRTFAPLNEPSPPITTKPSMPYFSKLATAFF